MEKLTKNVVKVFSLFLILFFLGCAASQKYTVDGELDNSKISGTVEVELKEIALAIGKVKGEGVLTYEGQEYPFTMSGFDYGSISKVEVYATGNVFHLDKILDFEGIYFQAKASFTFGKAGKSGIFLMNRRGVTIHLASREEKGFDLTLGRGGINVKFKDQEEKTLK